MRVDDRRAEGQKCPVYKQSGHGPCKYFSVYFFLHSIAYGNTVSFGELYTYKNLNIFSSPLALKLLAGQHERLWFRWMGLMGHAPSPEALLAIIFAIPFICARNLGANL